MDKNRKTIHIGDDTLLKIKKIKKQEKLHSSEEVIIFLIKKYIGKDNIEQRIKKIEELLKIKEAN